MGIDKAKLTDKQREAMARNAERRADVARRNLILARRVARWRKKAGV